MNSCCKACTGRGFRHLFKSDFYGEENDSFACSRHMRKEAMLHRIKLGFVRRVMSNAYFHANSVRQVFQGVLEDVAIARIAATAIAEQEHGRRPRVMNQTIMLPGMSDAVAGEFAGVVADAQVDVPVV